MSEMESTAGALAGKRILVVEDQYLVASDLRRALEGVAAIVIGPTGTAAQGIVLAEEREVDAAILDVNLRGGTSLAIAERLASRAIPYMFLTGKDGWALPEVFRDVPRMLKPYKMSAVIDCLRRLTSKEEP